MSKALGLLFGAMWTGHGGVMPVIYLGRWPFMALSDLRPAWTTALKPCQPKERYMLKTDLVWALEILNATNLRFIRLPHRVSHYTVLNIVLNFLLPLASGSPLTFLSAAITDGSHSLTAVPASLVLCPSAEIREYATTTASVTGVGGWWISVSSYNLRSRILP